MEDLPGADDLDAQLIVDRLRALLASTPVAYPRGWAPQASFDEVLLAADREAIHLHPSIHHLHHRWDMGAARSAVGSGRGPKAIVTRLLARIVNIALDRYLNEEQAFRAAVAQSIDALAYRIDEIAQSDERELLDLVRRDLLSLAQYVEHHVATPAPVTE